LATYVSMLRGINVGGNKRMKMEKLRESFEALGFKRVQTLIQSGNVVFQAAKSSPPALSKKIEQRLVEDFEFSVPVVTRTAEEMRQAVENNPFLKERGIDVEKIHVMFLSECPAPQAIAKLEAFTVAPERSRCLGKEIYLYLPNGVAESKLMKAPLDRTLAVQATARNWKTVNSLHRMCQDCG
jgi:uncharacterized protein (DUF1697 family)